MATKRNANFHALRKGYVPQMVWRDKTSETQIREPLDIIKRFESAARDQIRSVCIVENISSDIIDLLQREWGLETRFFNEYAQNPKKEVLWTNIDAPAAYQKEKCYSHLDGIFEYHGVKINPQEPLSSLPNRIGRHCFRNTESLIESNSRISYYRVNPWLYLFLVDAPIQLAERYLYMPSRAFPTFRLLYAKNNGGVILPQLLPRHIYSLFENLKSFFRHPWHMNLLYPAESGVISSTSLLYLLARSLWETNTRHLTKSIKRISFDDIRQPSSDISDRLHDLREDLFHTKQELIETKTYASDIAKKELGSQTNGEYNYGSRGGPIHDLQRIYDEVIELEHFLMETFQLLMSTISIRDSQASIGQTKRTTRLTQLAFIYIPLSFVTGIFGMNIAEINGSALNLWAVFVCAIVVIAVTVTVFLCHHYILSKLTTSKQGTYISSRA